LGGVWKDGYQNRLTCASDPVDVEFIDSTQIPALSLLKSSSLWKLVNPGNISYPRLTRLFYINMVAKRDHGELSLETIVKGKTIIISKTFLATLLKTSLDISTDSHPSRLECVQNAKASLFLHSDPRPKQVTHSVLNLDAKVLHTLLVRCILPRANSRELVTDSSLEIIYLLLHGYAIDLPELILHHMQRALSGSRAVPLPFANFLPRIFAALDISLSHEDIETHNNTPVNADTFSRLGIFRIPDGTWKLRQDLNATEMAALPSSSKGKQPVDVPTASSSSLSALNSRLDEFEFSLDHVRQELIDLRSDFDKRIDSTHELLAIVHQKVNQLFYLSALNFTATGSIMPISEDAEKHTRERAANVLLNCERKVRDQPILRPTHTEPTVLTVEEYGVVKRYRDAEAKRRVDAMMKDKVFADAHNRWKEKAWEDVRQQQAKYWYDR